MKLVSLLDNDLYKFTMQQAVLHRFSDIEVEYTLIVRDSDLDLSCVKAPLIDALASWSSLGFAEDELAYLQALPFFRSDYIDYLRGFRLNTDYVHIEEGAGLHLTVRGPWLETILFEIPLLMSISELYYQQTQPNFDFSEGKKRLAEKIAKVQKVQASGFMFADFGTRRRFSHDWQAFVLKAFQSELEHFKTTSNVYFAKQLGLSPIGTMAHEFIQAGQALARSLHDSQRFAWQTWLAEYGDQLGIALTDTLGQHAFLRDFNAHFANAFAGVRQDSGDPFEWGEVIIRHYEQLGIDPKTKTLVFSDALTIDKALALYETFSDRIRVVFGIGTHLMNDVGVPALPIVIKLSECRGQAVAKLSDTPEKIFCKDAEFLAQLEKSAREA